ncbi:hypothetical protein JNUCC1_03082 [Lentibacillus sp. JNUCC-1]|uniref:Mbeg1-like protein n=1 Tax=Lentibacillus sp. JNUCC-1 TaxID=2654513 RepID=UPI0012E77E12|nr:Mbeg1-like protein [Lentibacillus sp. JNUCC-1]MUV39209.1 hypothetical protein [Lentibacillus sp. JNUCC-1]
MFKPPMKKAVSALFAVALAFQFIWVPSAGAVESWSGTPWQGDAWEGTPWNAEDFIWQGDSWEGEGTEGDGTDGQKTDGNGVDSSGNGDMQTDEAQEQNDAQESDTDAQAEVVEECLPSPDNADCDDDADTLDLSTKEKIKEAVVQFEKDNPYLFLPDSPVFQEQREEQFARLEKEFAKLVERPHGRVDDITIADNVMATLADSGYSDGKLGTEVQNQNEAFLAQHGWNEIGTQFNDDSGFHARAFNQAEEGTIVVSFAGTEDLQDGITDAALAFGYGSKQFEEAAEYVEELIEQYPGHQIVLTGHSLGGAIAQYTSLNTNVPAITWNAPGIKTRDYSFFENPLSIGMSDSNVDVPAKFFDENGLFDDLIVNHMMEEDDIGTYHIHAGQSIVYSDDGTSSIRDDYSGEAHKSNTLWSLIGTAIGKGFDSSTSMFGSHGLGNFFALMGLC